MGSIIERTRKDGSKAFVAQIVIKKAGAILHREAETFDRKQAANAWIVKREAELKRPGGLEQKEDPALSVVINRYIAESVPSVFALVVVFRRDILAGVVLQEHGCRDRDNRGYKNIDCNRRPRLIGGNNAVAISGAGPPAVMEAS
jgi:hypothetical protein